jgi:hypothetical protein
MSIKNYKNFKSIEEVRTAKKCPVVSFKPIRDSETYQDMMGMGFIEVLADNPLGILAKATEEERNFKDRLGNIAFYHPAFKGARLTYRASRNASEGYPHFNIKFDGGVRVVEGPNNTAELPGISSDLRNKCMTVEDYIFKMSFLVKYTMAKGGLRMTDNELFGNETYKQLIERRVKEDPKVMKDLDIQFIPPSMRDTSLYKGIGLMKRFNFGE